MAAETATAATAAMTKAAVMVAVAAGRTMTTAVRATVTAATVAAAAATTVVLEEAVGMEMPARVIRQGLPTSPVYPAMSMAAVRSSPPTKVVTHKTNHWVIIRASRECDLYLDTSRKLL
ncbi:hypothetical protein, partial [Marinobacter sp.]|uniref:hypothetical protein n=1 Tax=Marinobacter sp. TaxID=50741 RepID=UPI0032996A6F